MLNHWLNPEKVLQKAFVCEIKIKSVLESAFQVEFDLAGKRFLLLLNAQCL